MLVKLLLALLWNGRGCTIRTPIKINYMNKHVHTISIFCYNLSRTYMEVIFRSINVYEKFKTMGMLSITKWLVRQLGNAVSKINFLLWRKIGKNSKRLALQQERTHRVLVTRIILQLVPFPLFLIPFRCILISTLTESLNHYSTDLTDCSINGMQGTKPKPL